MTYNVEAQAFADKMVEIVHMLDTMRSKAIDDMVHKSAYDGWMAGKYKAWVAADIIVRYLTDR